MTIWDTLGVPPDSDRDAVRRGYARKLKLTHPEDDPEGFKTLREAYEMALRHIEFARWEEDAGADAGDDDEAAPRWPGEDAPPAPALDPAPAAPPPERSSGPEPGEISALLAARDAERAALHAAMRGLDQALRGTWRASDEELEALFNDILAAPAMGEIALRDEVESWSAELIAATIPRSDAILLQAVTQFGWNEDPHRPVSYAVAACLERIDEWRIIQELGHHRHRFNAAWRSLTRPAGAWWSWRLDAFRPGLETGVATLLGLRGPVAPGLHYSFKADSVERWQRFIARPHLTLTILGAIPGVALLAFIIGASLNPDRAAAGPDVTGLWVMLGAALAAPVLLFALHALRFANDRLGLAGWKRDGWMLGYVALAALAALLPASPWSFAGFAGAALLVWGWMTATTAPPARADIAARIGKLWLPLAGLGFVALIALVAFPVPQALILCGMALLYLLVRLGGWDDGVAGLRGTIARGPWVALAVVVALFVPATAVALLALGKVPGYFWFHAAALATLGAAPVLAAAAGMAEPGGGNRVSRGVVAVRVALFALLGVAWFLTIDSLPPSKRDTSLPPVTVRAPDADATGPGTLRGNIVAALGEGSTAKALAALAQSQPGFGQQTAEGNPQLYRQIEDAIDAGIRGDRSRGQAADAVVALIAQSYRARLAVTDDSLVREEFAIRLFRLKELQSASADACIEQRRQLDEAALSDATRRRQTAQALNVVSNPTIGSEAGFFTARLSAPAWDERAAVLADTDVPTYRSDLAGKRGSARQCAAMIARLKVLVGNVYNRDPLLLQTMRAELLREGTANAPPLE